jgi:hypothetical protein
MTIAGGTRKLVVNAVIINIQSGESIEVPLHVDGGCEVAELVLLPEDILALNFSSEPFSTIQACQADGSTILITEYATKVLVELRTDTSEVWTASLEASVVNAPLVTNSELPSPELHGVPGVDDTSRLLGYGGLNRFGLKQDFYQHKLVKVLRKL